MNNSFVSGGNRVSKIYSWQRKLELLIFSSAELRSSVSILVLYSVMGHTVMSEVVFTGFNCMLNCTILWCAVGKLVCPVSTCTDETLSHKHSKLLSAWHAEVFSLQPLFQSVVRHESNLEHWSVPAVGINATFILEPGGKCKTWEMFEGILSVTSC